MGDASPPTRGSEYRAGSMGLSPIYAMTTSPPSKLYHSGSSADKGSPALRSRHHRDPDVSIASHSTKGAPADLLMPAGAPYGASAVFSTPPRMPTIVRETRTARASDSLAYCASPSRQQETLSRSGGEETSLHYQVISEGHGGELSFHSPVSAGASPSSQQQRSPRPEGPQGQTPKHVESASPRTSATPRAFYPARSLSFSPVLPPPPAVAERSPSTTAAPPLAFAGQGLSRRLWLGERPDGLTVSAKPSPVSHALPARQRTPAPLGTHSSVRHHTVGATSGCGQGRAPAREPQPAADQRDDDKRSSEATVVGRVVSPSGTSVRVLSYSYGDSPYMKRLTDRSHGTAIAHREYSSAQQASRRDGISALMLCQGGLLQQREEKMREASMETEATDRLNLFLRDAPSLATDAGGQSHRLLSSSPSSRTVLRPQGTQNMKKESAAVAVPGAHARVFLADVTPPKEAGHQCRESSMASARRADAPDATASQYPMRQPHSGLSEHAPRDSFHDKTSLKGDGEGESASLVARDTPFPQTPPPPPPLTAASAATEESLKVATPDTSEASELPRQDETQTPRSPALPTSRDAASLRQQGNAHNGPMEHVSGLRPDEDPPSFERNPVAVAEPGRRPPLDGMCSGESTVAGERSQRSDTSVSRRTRDAALRLDAINEGDSGDALREAEKAQSPILKTDPQDAARTTALQDEEEDCRYLITGECPPPKVFARWAERFLRETGSPAARDHSQSTSVAAADNGQKRAAQLSFLQRASNLSTSRATGAPPPSTLGIGASKRTGTRLTTSQTSHGDAASSPVSRTAPLPMVLHQASPSERTSQQDSSDSRSPSYQHLYEASTALAEDFFESTAGEGPPSAAPTVYSYVEDGYSSPRASASVVPAPLSARSTGTPAGEDPVNSSSVYMRLPSTPSRQSTVTLDEIELPTGRLAHGRVLSAGSLTSPTSSARAITAYRSQQQRQPSSVGAFPAPSAASRGTAETYGEGNTIVDASVSGTEFLALEPPTPANYVPPSGSERDVRAALYTVFHEGLQWICDRQTTP